MRKQIERIEAVKKPNGRFGQSASRRYGIHSAIKIVCWKYFFPFLHYLVTLGYDIGVPLSGSLGADLRDETDTKQWLYFFKNWVENTQSTTGFFFLFLYAECNECLTEWDKILVENIFKIVILLLRRRSLNQICGLHIF